MRYFTLLLFSPCLAIAGEQVNPEWLSGQLPNHRPPIVEARSAQWVTGDVYSVDWGTHVEYLNIPKRRPAGVRRVDSMRSSVVHNEDSEEEEPNEYKVAFDAYKEAGETLDAARNVADVLLACSPHEWRRRSQDLFNPAPEVVAAWLIMSLQDRAGAYEIIRDLAQRTISDGINYSSEARILGEHTLKFQKDRIPEALSILEPLYKEVGVGNLGFYSQSFINNVIEKLREV